MVVILALQIQRQMYYLASLPLFMLTEFYIFFVLPFILILKTHFFDLFLA
jgi:hypothetical protein